MYQRDTRSVLDRGWFKSSRLRCLCARNIFLTSSLVAFMPMAVHAVSIDTTIDGVVDIDPEIKPLIQDMSGDVGEDDQIDWTHLYRQNEGDDLYVVYKTRQNINFVDSAWRYHLFLDTDLDSLSGFQGASESFVFGADYMVEGGLLYKYSGDDFTWAWENLGWVTYSYSGNTLEMIIDSARIDGDLQNAPMMLHASNMETEDYAYQSPIIIDGDFADWEVLAPVIVIDDPEHDGDGSDWTQMRLSLGPGNLLLSYEMRQDFDVKSYNEQIQNNLILLDVDQSVETGYTGDNGELLMGADLKIQGGQVFRYESGDWVSLETGQLLLGYSGNQLEMMIPWTALGMAGPQPMNISLYGQTFAGMSDVLPDSLEGFYLGEDSFEPGDSDGGDTAGPTPGVPGNGTMSPMDIPSTLVGWSDASVGSSVHLVEEGQQVWYFSYAPHADNYLLQAKGTSGPRCLALPNWSDSLPILSRCDSGDRQKWEIKGDSSDGYTLRNTETGGCLSLANTNEDDLFVTECSGSSDQKFKLN